MKRHFLYNILFAASLVGITACSDDVANGTSTVGEANNEVRFATGVVSGYNTTGSRGASRANYDTEHYQFHALSAGTKLHIRTEGTWTGKEPSAITFYTQTGTAGEADGTLSPISNVGIYWDDYGMGDPANKTTGRAAGLNVYAACVNGEEASAIGTIADWESLAWTLSANMSNWEQKDLLASNNNSDNASVGNSELMNKDKSGRYKFDTQLAGTACNLELHHMMSKVTVNLKAGNGFPVDGEGVSYFENDPSVKLTSLNLSGTVNLKTLTTSSPSNAGNAVLKKAAEATDTYTATYEGLIFPGNALADEHKKETAVADAAGVKGVAQINCDGNILNVYADELMTAMNTADADHVFHSGKNYILNITVNKTEIIVKAYVTDWVDVTADVADPKIEVTTSYGDDSGNPAANDFSFYLGENNVSDFGIAQTGYFSANAETTHTGTGGETVWTLGPKLYWPNHQTAYHFRGIWPKTRAAGADANAAVPEVVTADAKQVIAVKNVDYAAGTYPSDLMIGMPKDEPAEGITATEGKINLNFEYMMSQVQVNLTTSGSTDSKVDFGTMGESNQAQVEIVGGYTDGNVLLENFSCELGTKADYTMTAKTDVQRWDAVCPQSVAELKFKITITNSDGTTDTYSVPVKDIKVGAQSITAWERGKKYIYTLNITKTQINFSVSITDWVTVSGNQQIWF